MPRVVLNSGMPSRQPSALAASIGLSLAVAVSTPTARADIAVEDCTVAKQCPKGGTSFTHFSGDRHPFYFDNPALKGLEQRCEDKGAIVMVVMCPPGEAAPKRGLCQRSAVSGGEGDGSPWSVAFAVSLLVVVIVARGRARRNGSRS